MKERFGWLLSFLKIGSIGFGGGTSLIPVIEQEMVENRKKVTKEEYDSAVIAASITPGALPVEISAYLGKNIGGTPGMLMAAACMILPGVVLTVLMLATMSTADAEIIKQIEIISIGITAFIFSMMTKYIRGTFVWAKARRQTSAALVIVLGVFALNAGKSVVKILGQFGIEMDPVFSVSTVHILIMAFFVICYAGSRMTPARLGISVVICIIYSMFRSKAQLMAGIIVNDILYNIALTAVCLLMTVLSVYGVAGAREKTEQIRKVSPKPMLKEEMIWFILLVVACVPAYIVMPETLAYIGRGFLSSIISFGGGDAYLTVADGFFVNTGMISESDFYGRLVMTVNVLPGSILCKTLTGVGYYMGYNSGGLTAGLLVAFAGFVCSLVGSCAVITLIRYFFDSFEQMKAFKVLKDWIKAIVSGLLGSVILSLIYQCLIVARNYSCPGWLVLLELAVVYGINLFMNTKMKTGTWVNVLVSIGTALVLGNIIM